MRTYILLIFMLLTALEAISQFRYGTPLIDGSIQVKIDSKKETYCNNKLRDKFEEKISFSTNLTGIIVLDSSNIEWKKEMAKEKGFRGTLVNMNNYTTTMQEGQELDFGNPEKAPLYSVSASVKTKKYGLEPCSNEYECSDNYKPALIQEGTYNNYVSHHDRIGVKWITSIIGLEKCSKYLFLNISAGSTWIENGKAEVSRVQGQLKTLKRDEKVSDECKTYWDSEKNGYVVNLSDDLVSGKITPSEDGREGWVGSEGIYSQSKENYENNELDYSTREQIQLMRIDTGELFKFVREKQRIHSFVTSGNYKMESFDKNGNKTIITTNIDAIFTLGKKPDFTIEAQNEAEFKEWLPGHPDFPETDKPLKIKARYSGSSQNAKDTIKFQIVNVSHLPGYCTNYPVLPDNPPVEEPDLFFAPQGEQTDPSIKIVNDTVAITTKKVEEASIIVKSRDFGANAVIRAWALTNGDIATCPYNNQEDMRIPYDMNENLMADKWEEDMGLSDPGVLDDDDNIPDNQDNIGDGLSTFEEYRGFICQRNIEAPGDKDHTIRLGEHTRTSPLGKDIFIYDRNDLFARYVESSNPTETHWHLLKENQVKLPPIDQVTDVIVTYNEDCPADNDNSPEAQKMKGNYKRSESILTNWEKQDFRRINANSPEKYRNNKQFALYLLESPFESTKTGVSIEKLKPSSNSPIFNYHLTVIPKFANIQASVKGMFSSLKKNSSHPDNLEEYTDDVLNQVIKIVYESTIPHEIGHCIGISHHTQGHITFFNAKTNSSISCSSNEIASINENDNLQEVDYLEGEKYQITGAQEALWAMGVVECCMRYTSERETDFVRKNVLKSALKYCKKNQEFLDGNGNMVPADACFSKIKIKCSDVK